MSVVATAADPIAAATRACLIERVLGVMESAATGTASRDTGGTQPTLAWSYDLKRSANELVETIHTDLILSRTTPTEVLARSSLSIEVEGASIVTVQDRTLLKAILVVSGSACRAQSESRLEFRAWLSRPGTSEWLIPEEQRVPRNIASNPASSARHTTNHGRVGNLPEGSVAGLSVADGAASSSLARRRSGILCLDPDLLYKPFVEEAFERRNKIIRTSYYSCLLEALSELKGFPKPLSTEERDENTESPHKRGFPRWDVQVPPKNDSSTNDLHATVITHWMRSPRRKNMHKTVGRFNAALTQCDSIPPMSFIVARPKGTCWTRFAVTSSQGHETYHIRQCELFVQTDSGRLVDMKGHNLITTFTLKIEDAAIPGLLTKL